MTTSRVEARKVVTIAEPPVSVARETTHRDEIFRLALMIEGDIGHVRHWYGEEAIEEFGCLTPQELCEAGLGGLLVAYLQQILRGQRD
jgi:hypothetical protein